MSRQKYGVRANPTDYYPTPPWCYENLNIDWELFSSIMEPCRGDGRILEFFRAMGKECKWAEILEGKDFFEYTDHHDLVFTNPPFSLALEFVTHALTLSPTVIMLLRLNFLGSITRHNWWKDNSPIALHVLSKRPSFTGKGTDATDYAWFIWDKTNKLKKGIFFVPPPNAEQVALAKELAS